MRKNLFFIAILFSGLVACKSKSAFNYSQDMVAKEKALAAVLGDKETKVQKYMAANQYDSIAIVGEEMEKQVQLTMDEINAMPVPKAKEADNFKAGMLNYFGYMKSLYTGYKKYGKAATDEERQQVLTEEQKLYDKKATVLGDIQKIQRKYAEANGFKVQ